MTSDEKDAVRNLIVGKRGWVNPRSAQEEWWEKRGQSLLYRLILQYTSFLSDSCTYRERVHCVLNDITEVPLCRTCQRNRVKYSQPKGQYNPTCGGSCASSGETTQKRQKTLLSKYGVTAPAQHTDVKEKMRKTSLERYGVSHPSQREESNTKRRATIIAAGGHGNAAQSHYSRETFARLNSKSWLFHTHHVADKSMMEIAKELGVTYKTIRDYLTHHEIEKRYFYSSVGEREICAFVKSLVEKVVTNDRRTLAGKEIDVLCPEQCLAIEYNGIFWHSFGDLESENRNIHREKLLLCREKGLRLVQIFEDEWLNPTKRAIWMSMLQYALGKTPRSLGARQCEVRIIPTAEKTKFLQENHLQGACASQVNLGLYCAEELVSLMTFAKSRFNKQFDWEIVRFCNLRNVSVVGGAQKLFTHFVRLHRPGSMVSYCDLRYGVGKLYTTLGFELSHEAAPNYFYLNPKTITLESRIRYQKHKLSAVLDSFDPALSEAENMFQNGFRRVWDCGNAVYVKRWE